MTLTWTAEDTIVDSIRLWFTWRRLRMKRHVRIDEMLPNARRRSTDSSETEKEGEGRLAAHGSMKMVT